MFVTKLSRSDSKNRVDQMSKTGSFYCHLAEQNHISFIASLFDILKTFALM